MVLKNKEGNCIRTVSKSSKIEALKALGYTTVTEETDGSVTAPPQEDKAPEGKEKGKDKNKNKDKTPAVTEETDGSVTVKL